MSSPRIADFVAREFAAATKKWHEDNRDTFPWSDVADAYKRLSGHDLHCVQLHHANYCVWHHEDIARSDDKAAIVAAKRGIDSNNQTRNDLIETIDNSLICGQNAVDAEDDKVIFNTETPGSIIDRVSVLDLKCWHTQELLDGIKISKSTRARADSLHNRLLILRDQRQFLVTQLKILIGDMWKGRRQVRLFRQLKMYNSPETNRHHRDNAENAQ